MKFKNEKLETFNFNIMYMLEGVNYSIDIISVLVCIVRAYLY